MSARLKVTPSGNLPAAFDEENQCVATPSKASERSVKSSSFLLLVESAREQKFRRSVSHDTPAFSLATLMVVFVAFFALELLQAILFHARHTLLPWLPSLLSFFVCVAMLALLKAQTKPKPGHEVSRREDLFAIATSLLLGFSMVAHSFSESLRNDFSFLFFGYRPGEAHSTLVLVVLQTLPILLEAALCWLSWEATCVCWLICAACMIASLCHMGSLEMVVIAAFGAACTFTSLYLRRSNRISLFVRLREREIALRNNLETARMKSVHEDAEEWRYLIANVAHDLQTPLAAFRNGVDLLATTLEDIRRLVTASALHSDLLIAELASGKSAVQSVRHTCSYMHMIVHRALDYSKASRGVALVCRKEALDLMDCLASPLACIQELQCQHSSTPIIELLPIPEQISRNLVTDPQWLQENLLCLLSNAVKYSSPPSVTLRVSLLTHPIGRTGFSASTKTRKVFANLRRRASEPLLCFEVEDRGPGVPEDQWVRIFESVAQSQRCTGGMGLGLYSLAKRLQALGGCYGVGAREDGLPGARFWFAIPYEPVASDHIDLLQDTSSGGSCASSTISAGVKTVAATAGESAGPVPPIALVPDMARPSISSRAQSPVQVCDPCVMHAPVTTPRSIGRPDEQRAHQPAAISPWRVLVVDDALPILKMTSRLLDKSGHVVVSAENGLECLRILQKQDFDIILMDLQMPIMDGFEATKRIRCLEKADRGCEIEEGMACVTQDDDEDLTERVFVERDSPPRVHSYSIEDCLDSHADSVRSTVRSECTHVHGSPSSERTGEFSHRTVTYSSTVSAHTQQMHVIMRNLAIRFKTRQQPLVIIGCSANSDDGTIELAYQAGIDAFLPKPFAIKSFQEMVCKVMAVREENARKSIDK